MPLKETTLLKQLEVAQADRSNLEKTFADLELKKQPKWRQANALVNSLEQRLEKARDRSKTASQETVEAE